uniref:Venom POBP 1 n=1 Tax=Ectomocoris sp. TaxID=3104572 RepID=A0AB38ZEC9_9HEMI
MLTKIFAGLLLVTMFSQTLSFDHLTYLRLKECQKEHKISENIINQVKMWKSLPNEGIYKCFLACWLDKLSVLTMDKYTNKKVADVLCDFNYDSEKSRNMAESFINYCEDKVQLTDKCQSAYEIYDCYATLMRENPGLDRHALYPNEKSSLTSL